MQAGKYVLLVPAVLMLCGTGVAGAERLAPAAARSASSSAASHVVASARSSGVAAVVRLDPLMVALTLQSNAIAVGQADVATISVLDHSKSALTGVVATLLAPAGVRVSPPLVRTLGTLAAGATGHANWSFCATAAGAYRITAFVLGSSTAGQVVVAYSQPAVLTVTKAQRRC